MPKVKLDWNIEGLQFALKEEDIVVIVDILRFSSAVTTAIANGFIIYPISNKRNGKELAKSIGAEMSGRSETAQYSLSPQSFLKTSDNKKVVLYSPNGAACAELVKTKDIAYIGSLLNAKAVGEQVTKISKKINQDVTIIAAGEKRGIESKGKIEYLKDKMTLQKVFALEDYLGCGAIISYINLPKTPEAKVSEFAFKVSKSKLKKLLMESFSGRYLIQENRKDDIDWSLQLNYYDVVPVISEGKIVKTS